MKFTQLPTDTFKQLQLNAGVIASAFTPASGTLSTENILGATNGGFTISCVPSFKDFGEGVDNCPLNTKELKRIDTYECKASGSFVTMTTALAKTLIGAATIDSSNTDKVTPDADLETSDFSNIWIIGDYSDKNGATNGGFVAIHLLNALSTGGFSFKTSDKDKGAFDFEFTGHYSISALSTVPFEVYIHAGTAES